MPTADPEYARNPRTADDRIRGPRGRCPGDCFGDEGALRVGRYAQEAHDRFRFKAAPLQRWPTADGRNPSKGGHAKRGGRLV